MKNQRDVNHQHQNNETTKQRHRGGHTYASCKERFTATATATKAHSIHSTGSMSKSTPAAQSPKQSIHGVHNSQRRRMSNDRFTVHFEVELKKKRKNFQKSKNLAIVGS